MNAFQLKYKVEHCSIREPIGPLFLSIAQSNLPYTENPNKIKSFLREEMFHSFIGSIEFSTEQEDEFIEWVRMINREGGPHHVSP